MPAHKRPAPEPSAGRRRSRRLASGAASKSVYFQEDDGSNDEAPRPDKRRRGRAAQTQPGSRKGPGWHGGAATGGRHGSDGGDYDEEDDMDEEKENDDDDNDDDEDDDDNEPRKVEIIPLEKMRDAGGVSYEDRRLHRNTLLFLRDLKANNRRSWLKSHDGEYRRALRDWQSFVETMTQRVAAVDETVPELPVKDVAFRIHRDIRFSKDPTPYKPHFAAAWSRTGRKGPYACYYVHCEPGAALVGGGLWHPGGGPLGRLRRSIDARPARWRAVLADARLRAAFLPGLAPGAGAEAAVAAFVAQNQDNALKTRPQGWDATHRDIELLKLRNFALAAPLDAEALCRDDAQHKLEDLVRALAGFVSFLNSIVMPDPNLDGVGDGSADELGPQA